MRVRWQGASARARGSARPAGRAGRGSILSGAAGRAPESARLAPPTHLRRRQACAWRGATSASCAAAGKCCGIAGARRGRGGASRAFVGSFWKGTRRAGAAARWGTRTLTWTAAAWLGCLRAVRWRAWRRCGKLRREHRRHIGLLRLKLTGRSHQQSALVVNSFTWGHRTIRCTAWRHLQAPRCGLLRLEVGCQQSALVGNSFTWGR